MKYLELKYLFQGSIVLGKIPDVPLPTSKFVRTQQTGLVRYISQKLLHQNKTVTQFLKKKMFCTYQQTGWLLDYLVLSTPGAVGSFMCGGNVRADKDFISGEARKESV